MKFGIVGVILAFHVSAAIADQIPAKTVDAVDYFLDWKSLKGQRVLIIGCKILAADIDDVMCQTERTPSSLFIDSKTLDVESLRRAMKACSTEKCVVDVTAVVDERYAKPRLVNASFSWK